MHDISKKPFFTTADAKSNGISRRMLSYYVKQGSIERIKNGVYAWVDYSPEISDIEWLDLAIAANAIKGGVICLVSALVYYNLTDEIMNRTWIAVEHSRTDVTYPNCKIVRMRNIKLGVKTITISNMKVKIFDRERTVVDSFRLLDEEVAIKSLKAYLKQNPDLNKLHRYAKKMRTSNIANYIKALIT